MSALTIEALSRARKQLNGYPESVALNGSRVQAHYQEDDRGRFVVLHGMSDEGGMLKPLELDIDGKGAVVDLDAIRIYLP